MMTVSVLSKMSVGGTTSELADRFGAGRRGRDRVIGHSNVLPQATAEEAIHLPLVVTAMIVTICLPVKAPRTRVAA
jgi:hypothetical protein